MTGRIAKKLNPRTCAICIVDGRSTPAPAIDGWDGIALCRACHAETLARVAADKILPAENSEMFATIIAGGHSLADYAKAADATVH